MGGATEISDKIPCAIESFSLYKGFLLLLHNASKMGSSRGQHKCLGSFSGSEVCRVLLAAYGVT